MFLRMYTGASVSVNIDQPMYWHLANGIENICFFKE